MNPFSVLTPAGAAKVVFRGLEAVKSVVSGVFGQRTVQSEAPSPPRQSEVKLHTEGTTRHLDKVLQMPPDARRTGKEVDPSNRNDLPGKTPRVNENSSDSPVGFNFEPEDFSQPEQRSEQGMQLEVESKDNFRARYGSRGPDLSDVFRDPALMGAFEAHCEKRYAIENLEFWRAARTFSMNPTVGNALALKALLSGEQAVNLDDKSRKGFEVAVNHLTAICAHMKSEQRLDLTSVQFQGDSKAIDAAFRHVDRILDQDTWPGFRKSIGF